MSCPEEIIESFEEFLFLLLSTISALVITEVTGRSSTFTGRACLMDFDVLLVALTVSVTSSNNNQEFGSSKLLHRFRAVKGVEVVVGFFGVFAFQGSENLLDILRLFSKE